MTQNPQLNSPSSGAGASVALGFVLGALVGAGVALLLAPGPGRETRLRVADAGRRWRGVARRRFDEARDAADALRKDAKSALEAGREAFEHGSKTHEPRAESRTEPNG